MDERRRQEEPIGDGPGGSSAVRGSGEPVAGLGIDALGPRVYMPPFRYDGMGGFVVDARGQRIVDMRGWGYLSTAHHDTGPLQDAVAGEVVKALNAHWRAAPSKDGGAPDVR